MVYAFCVQRPGESGQASFPLGEPPLPSKGVKNGHVRGLSAICGLLQPLRSLEMAKQTRNALVSTDFETKAEEIIGLTFDLCEQELYPHPTPFIADCAKAHALQAATLSIQEA